MIVSVSATTSGEKGREFVPSGATTAHLGSDTCARCHDSTGREYPPFTSEMRGKPSLGILASTSDSPLSTAATPVLSIHGTREGAVTQHIYYVPATCSRLRIQWGRKAKEMERCLTLIELTFNGRAEGYI